jgi:hypothetical protein
MTPLDTVLKFIDTTMKASLVFEIFSFVVYEDLYTALKFVTQFATAQQGTVLE